MFHFPAFPLTHYEFTRKRPDITLARFPHSDILGSTLACQLPEAYRRLQRPSSALHTKASTERPKTPTKQNTHPHTKPQTALNAQNNTTTTTSTTSHKNQPHQPQSPHAQACKDAHVHYTIPKHHTNTPTNKTHKPHPSRAARARHPKAQQHAKHHHHGPKPPQHPHQHSMNDNITRQLPPSHDTLLTDGLYSLERR